MPPVLIAQLLVQFGLPLTQQIVAWIEAGKKEVTQADLKILADFASKRSADYLTAAGGQPAPQQS